MAKREEKHTVAELRERIKEEIRASDKSGEPGHWSARKPQLLVKEYEKDGGYKGDKVEGQKRLEQWTEEEWHTQEGRARAPEDGEARRYLPQDA